jgi:ketosteroid isomerase-like protein
MAQSDVEIVRAAFDAWNTEGIDAFARFVADDIEWIEVGGRLDRPRSMGWETLRVGLESLYETWEYYRLEPEALREADGRVVAVLREVARGRTSGVEVEGEWGYVITLRDGRIAHVDAYRDPRQALEAAGLDA